MDALTFWSVCIWGNRVLEVASEFVRSLSSLAGSGTWLVDWLLGSPAPQSPEAGRTKA